MDDEEVLATVRDAIIWVKAEVVTLAPGQVVMASVLAEPPIYLDSLEFVAMVIRLEDTLGLEAEDEHFARRSIRTVQDAVAAVKSWIADDEATRK